jgi:SNF family Na+-dependent transporter
MAIGKKDIPERKTIVVLAMWDYFYLGLLLVIVRNVSGLDVKPSRAVIFIIYGALTLFYFFYYVYSNRYLRLYRKFEKKNISKKYIWILLISYFLFPILFMTMSFHVWWPK